MSENRLLSIISENTTMRGKFHRIDKDLRREVLAQITADITPKELTKIIRKVKRSH